MEIVVKYDEVIKAIDNHDTAREIIKNHFRKKGLRACFLPKTSETSGNGAHLHLSIWRGDENVFGDSSRNYGISEDGEAFMAGILKNYSALLPFLAPSANSMKRILPSYFVGAYKYWGIENKEAPIRLPKPLYKSDPVSNFEIKTLDNTTNMYYAVAAVIHLGAQGIS